MTAEATLSTSRVTHRAWLVLGLAFLVFLGLFSGVATATYNYVQSAMIQREATLETLGEVLVKPRNEMRFKQARHGERIQEGDTIKTPDGVQARLIIFDGSELQLAEDTTVEIGQLRSTRFVAGEQRIWLIQREGWTRLTVPASTGSMPREHHVLVGTMEVEAKSLPESETRLSIELRPVPPQSLDQDEDTPPEAQVAVERGLATVRTGSEEQFLMAGHKVATTGKAGLGPITSGPREYIRNGNFSVLVPARDKDDEIFPQYWETTNHQGGDGGDQWGESKVIRQMIDGKAVPVIALTRRVTARDNAVTGITQRLDLPLSHFESLRLHVRLQVEYHSLPGGGLMDSEYPIIIKVTYRDHQNRITSWYRGFYTHNEEKLRTDHGIRIQPGAWYDFTQDLLDLNANPKPAFIETLDIYASGHDFQSAVAHVSIVGE